ncbi:hypothetical protein LSAT2_019641 [Lamellibrachia satsuma]|nr:hypothetical protein LSAT2_019641 [Lamellibrachia satsuma]
MLLQCVTITALVVTSWSQCTDKFKTYPKQNVPGMKLAMGGVWSLDACKEKCVSDLSCLAIDFNTDLKHCYYLNDSRLLSHRRGHSFTQHLVLLKRCPKGSSSYWLLLLLLLVPIAAGVGYVLYQMKLKRDEEAPKAAGEKEEEGFFDGFLSIFRGI